MEDLDNRIAILEAFIGDLSAIRVYANSLQEVIDRYLMPLYIESGTKKEMLIDGYLGDLENIPHNVIIKVRAGHDLVLAEGERATIKFKRGTESKEYTLRKLVNKHLVDLESSNYTDGEVYDIYINSQDVAIITANDTGVRALAELSALTESVNNRLETLNTLVENNYNTLDSKTDEINTNISERITTEVNTLNSTITSNVSTLNSSINSAKTSANSYTDGKVKTATDGIAAINTFLSGISKSGNNYSFAGNVYAPYIETPSLRGTKTINFSGASGFTLPSGTLIADPSSNTGIANRQWVLSQITTAVNNYHANKHITGTADANSALSGKENGTFYYKLSQ